VDKKVKKKAEHGANAANAANVGRKFEKRVDGGKFNNKENGARKVGGKFEGGGKFGSMPAPRAGERGGDRRDRGKTAAAVAPAGAAAAAAPAAAPAAGVKLEPVPNPAPIRPGGKTLADLVRGEPAAAPAPARPQGGAPKGGVPRPQGAGKPAPKASDAADVPSPNFTGAATNEPVNWAKKVSGAQAPPAQPQQVQQQARPPQPAQQPPQQTRQAAPQPTTTTSDSFGFGFEAAAPASTAPRPQQQAAEQQAQVQDLGLQFGNFSSAGGDFGFGFDSSQQSTAGWGVQQQQQRQPAAKRQPTSRNSGVASKLPDATSFNGSATTSGPDGQPVMPAYFGGMMPNAYANYMMPPAVPMAGGYTGYEGYQAASVQSASVQEGAYADYYKQQAAAQSANAQALSGVSGDKSSNAQQMQAFANMPNAYGHPMYSYPYAMPHQPAYPYAVQSHYPYPPAAGVYPGAAPSAPTGGKQSAGSAPPGYKAQDGAAQYGAAQYGAAQYGGQYGAYNQGQSAASRDSQAAQYAEMQGYYTQYASQYAANGYRQ